MSNERKPKRLTLQVSDTVWNRMTGLRDATEASSLVEVIRRALAVYEFAVARKEAGERLVIVSEDGSQRELFLS